MSKITVSNKKDKNEVEYFCWNDMCGHTWKDVIRKEPYLCPKCGSHKITHRVPDNAPQDTQTK